MIWLGRWSLLSSTTLVKFGCECKTLVERLKRKQKGVNVCRFKALFVNTLSGQQGSADVLCGVLKVEQQCGTDIMKSQSHHMTSLPSCVVNTGLPLPAWHRFLETMSEFFYFCFSFHFLFRLGPIGKVRREKCANVWLLRTFGPLLLHAGSLCIDVLFCFVCHWVQVWITSEQHNSTRWESSANCIRRPHQLHTSYY